MLYPLKFKPIFKEKVWGGNKINTVYGLDYSPLKNCGEVWLISGVDGEQSIVSEGFLEGNELNELVEVYMADLVGEKNFDTYQNEFPLLIKLINSEGNLSVQVHPDDELAMKRHNSYGKTEMWYINQADEGAGLICGFNEKLDKDKYQQYIDKGRIKDILKEEKVREGDVFFIPAGCIHAIKSGILLTEIQQTSDITYRVYDWDRIEENGIKRELHTELALDAINFDSIVTNKKKYEKTVNEAANIALCEYFTVNLIQFNKQLTRDYILLDSFVIHVCQKGSYELQYENGIIKMKSGDAVLIPAIFTNIILKPQSEAEILEVYID